MQYNAIVSNHVVKVVMPFEVGFSLPSIEAFAPCYLKELFGQDEGKIFMH